MMYLCGAGVSSSGQATCPKEKCVGETGDGTVKSDQSIVVLHHYRLGHIDCPLSDCNTWMVK